LENRTGQPVSGSVLLQCAKRFMARQAGSWRTHGRMSVWQTPPTRDLRQRKSAHFTHFRIRRTRTFRKQAARRASGYRQGTAPAGRHRKPEIAEILASAFRPPRYLRFSAAEIERAAMRSQVAWVGQHSRIQQISNECSTFVPTSQPLSESVIDAMRTRPRLDHPPDELLGSRFLPLDARPRWHSTPSFAA
jgi:hypothetical protein